MDAPPDCHFVTPTTATRIRNLFLRMSFRNIWITTGDVRSRIFLLRVGCGNNCIGETANRSARTQYCDLPVRRSDGPPSHWEGLKIAPARHVFSPHAVRDRSEGPGGLGGVCLRGHDTFRKQERTISTSCAQEFRRSFGPGMNVYIWPHHSTKFLPCSIRRVLGDY